MFIRVFIDTSAMPRKPLLSQHGFSQLAMLSKAGLVLVEMSEIAMCEWQTQMEDDFQKAVREAQAGLRSLKQHSLFGSLNQSDVLSALVNSKSTMLEEAKSIAAKTCEDFFAALPIKKIKVNPEDAQLVLDSYFVGSPPFASAKSRKDIPDAFIYQSVTRQLDTHSMSDSVLISNDSGLSKAFMGRTGLEIFQSIQSFLQSKTGQLLNHQLSLYKLWNESAKEAAIAELRRNRQFISEKINECIDDEIIHLYLSDNELPSDDHDACINVVQPGYEYEVHWDRIEEVFTGWIQVPFSLLMECELGMLVYGMNSYCVPDWVEVIPGDFESEKHFEAFGYRRVKVTGFMTFHYSGDAMRATPLLPSNTEFDNIEVELLNTDD